MTKPLVLGIIGEKSSGKSNVFQYLAKKRGVFSGRTSAVLEDILVRLHLDVSRRPNNAKLAEALRGIFGDDVLARALLAEAATGRYKVISLEGMRRLKEVKALQRIPRFKLLYITAPAELRWQRARLRTARKRSDDRVSLAEYKKIERTLITEKDIPRMGQLADARIDNLGTKAELFKNVDAVLRRFGVKI